MPSKYLQPGEIVELVAPSGGVVSGGVYRIQQLVVMSLETKAEAATFRAVRRGVIKGVTKVGSQAWAIGQLVFWDNANARFTTTSASGLTACGFTASVVASGAGDTTGDVLLDGSARANVA